MLSDKRIKRFIKPFFFLFLLLGPILAPSFSYAVSDSNYQYKLQWANSDPYFIDVDSSGNVYVAGRYTNRVDKYSSDGTPILHWGETGNDNGKFNDPEGIAVDSLLGFVYVTDSNNNRVQQFDLQGVYRSQWGTFGSREGEFNAPSGIAVDKWGYVYVVDRENSRVQKFSNGRFQLQFGIKGTGNGEFHSPESIAVDSAGNIYVGDEENNRVQKFKYDGSFASILAMPGSLVGQVIDPEDVAVDKNDNVYVADSDNSRIQKFGSDGVVKDVWGETGSGDGRFADPRGIAIDSQGNVYVADTGNVRIQKFIPTTGTLVAACTDNRGEPLSAADIISTSQPEGQTPLQGTTDENGIAEFRGIRPGAYTLETSRDGQVLGSQSSEVSAGQETRSNFVTTSSTLTVTVVESNSPVAEAIVSMKVGGDVLTQTTGLDGTVIFSNIIPDNYVVTATKNEISIEKEVTVVEGNGNTLLITLTSATGTGQLKIKVKAFLSGTPVQGVTIEMRERPLGQTKIGLETDSNGNTEISGLMTGAYKFVATKPGYTITTYDLSDLQANVVNEIFIFITKIEVQKFVITTISSPQYTNTAFTVTIQAQDSNGILVTAYNGINSLSASVGSIIPENTAEFNEGQWTGLVSLNEIGYIEIMTLGNNIVGSSNWFKVLSASDLQAGDLEVTVKNEFGNTVGGAKIYCAPIVRAGFWPVTLDFTADTTGVAFCRDLLPLNYEISAFKDGYGSSSKPTITIVPNITTRIVVILKDPSPKNDLPGFQYEIILLGILITLLMLYTRFKVKN